MSDTEARDRLAQLLSDDWNPDRDPVLTAMFRDYAQTILAAGFRPPARTVSTVEEFDALVDGAVIRDSGECVAERWLGMWYVTGGGRYGGIELALPATVLYEPKDGE